MLAFKHRTIMTILLLVPLSIVAETVLDLKPGLKQLFIDDRFFAESSGIQLRINPPVKQGPVFQPEQPWESSRLGCYACVVDDAGVYKLWYDAYIGLRLITVPRSVCYATSTDGVHWSRREVNLYDWFGERENNIVMPGTTASVMVDPHAAPEHRFKALGMFFTNHLWSGAAAPGWHKTMGGLHMFSSPDGMHWKRVEGIASPFFHDSLNLIQFDERINKHVAYVRTHERGRTISRVVLDDPLQTPWPFRPPPNSKPNPHGIYPTTRDAYPVVLACDELDPPGTDVQMASIVRYPYAQEVYIALVALYRHFPETIKGQFSNDGVQDVQLAVSRDGIHWTRPERKPYISLGLAGGPEAGCLWPTQGMIRHQDQIYQYYSPTSHTHGDYDDSTRGEGGLYLLMQRLDGFVSADADGEGGSFTTPLLRFSGTRLEFNLDASALGSLSVEIRDADNRPLPGFTFDESIPIELNHLAAEARWSSGGNVGELQGKSVRLAVRMRHCKLYSFQFSGRAMTRRK